MVRPVPLEGLNERRAMVFSPDRDIIERIIRSDLDDSVKRVSRLPQWLHGRPVELDHDDQLGPGFTMAARSVAYETTELAVVVSWPTWPTVGAYVWSHSRLRRRNNNDGMALESSFMEIGPRLRELLLDYEKNARRHP